MTCSPKVHEYIHEMNLKVLRKYNCCTVGEMPCGVSQFEASQYVGKERRELSMVFQFDHMDLDGQNGNKWKPRKFELPELERVMRSWQQHMLGNNGTYRRSSGLSIAETTSSLFKTNIARADIVGVSRLEFFVPGKPRPA